MQRIKKSRQAIALAGYFGGWGTWIRTKTGGVRVRCPTVRRSPTRSECGAEPAVLQADGAWLAIFGPF